MRDVQAQAAPAIVDSNRGQLCREVRRDRHVTPVGTHLCALDAVMTFILLKLISLVVPLRASDGGIEAGDLAIHGIDPIPAGKS